MEDHTAAINIVSWFLLIVSTGAVAACLTTSWHIMRRKIPIMTLLLCTLASSVIAGANISLAVTHGLGKSSNNDAERQFSELQKAIYVSEIFHVLTLGLGKLCLIALFYSVLLEIGRARVILVVAAFVIAWTVTMIIALSLQCRPPDVWNLVSGICFDMTALWTYFGASNIAIEALMLIVPSIIIYRLHMTLRKRLVVIGCFSVRGLDIVVSAVQLRYSNAFEARSTLPLNLWPWVICSQVLQTSTIISACVPYLREFLESFPSGMLQPASVVHSELRYVYGSTRLMDSDPITNKSYELYYLN